ncbi:MAG: DUF4278 domain-containing protein [Cyanobacteria bacterium Co-bin8]|nr:DUF4278 domain-containing protein [Cyanobacteria bacterium Co-bin8]
MVLLTLLAIAVGAFAALCLMLVGLLETPWPILLTGLLLALYSLQRLSQQSQTIGTLSIIEQTAQPSIEKTSKGDAPEPDGEALMYRGIRYSPSCSDQNAVSEAELIEGKYRGQRWQRPTSAPSSKPDAASEMTYRGCKVRQPQVPEKPD